MGKQPRRHPRHLQIWICIHNFCLKRNSGGWPHFDDAVYRGLRRKGSAWEHTTERAGLSYLCSNVVNSW
jgi:hypothetical protein